MTSIKDMPADVGQAAQASAASLVATAEDLTARAVDALTASHDAEVRWYRSRTLWSVGLLALLAAAALGVLFRLRGQEPEAEIGSAGPV